MGVVAQETHARGGGLRLFICFSFRTRVRKLSTAHAMRMKQQMTQRQSAIVEKRRRRVHDHDGNVQ